MARTIFGGRLRATLHRVSNSLDPPSRQFFSEWAIRAGLPTWRCSAEWILSTNSLVKKRTDVERPLLQWYFGLASS